MTFPIEDLIQDAHRVADNAQHARYRWRRRAHPGDPDRRRDLEKHHAELLKVAEDLRRERIRASRSDDFNERYGLRLKQASDRVKKNRYAIYRMLNPGGRKWDA